MAKHVWGQRWVAIHSHKGHISQGTFSHLRSTALWRAESPYGIELLDSFQIFCQIRWQKSRITKVSVSRREWKQIILVCWQDKRLHALSGPPQPRIHHGGLTPRLCATTPSVALVIALNDTLTVCRRVAEIIVTE